MVYEQMDLLTIYIKPDSFILIPALYFIELFLRQTPQIPKWSHPWIKVTFAILACCLYYGWMIQSVVQGILVTGATMILQDLLHNTFFGIYQNQKENKEKKDDNHSNE